MISLDSWFFKASQEEIDEYNTVLKLFNIAEAKALKFDRQMMKKYKIPANRYSSSVLFKTASKEDIDTYNNLDAQLQEFYDITLPGEELIYLRKANDLHRYISKHFATKEGDNCTFIFLSIKNIKNILDAIKSRLIILKDFQYNDVVTTLENILVEWSNDKLIYYTAWY